MAAEFVTFTQGGRRVAFRRADIESFREPEPKDENLKCSLTVAGTEVRVEDDYDDIADRLNT